jgi:hypothetical protein
MAHQYKVGDRVRATAVEQNHPSAERLVRPGDIGRVIGCPQHPDCGPCIDWGDGKPRHMYGFTLDKIELTDAPAAAEPTCRHGTVGPACCSWCMLEARHGGPQQAAAQQQMAAQVAQAPSMQLARERRPVTSCESCDAHRADINRQANMLVGLRSELADVKGERDRQQKNLLRALDDLTWHKRELARLKGGRR